MTDLYTTYSPKSFLSQSDRSALEIWSRAKDRRPREARRADLLLLLDGGLSARKVAALVKINPNRVSHWRKRWERERFNGLTDKARSGRKIKLTDGQMAEILEILERFSKQPSLDYFAQKFKLSRMTISRFLRRQQMRLAMTLLDRKDRVRYEIELPSVPHASAPMPQLHVDASNDSHADALVKMMHEACELHYKYHHYAEDEARFRNIIALAKQIGDWHPAALQAELNIMYLWHGVNDLETSASRAQTLCSHMNCAKQDDPRIRSITFETHVFRARICEQHQDFNGVFYWLEKAKQELKKLSATVIPPDPMPAGAARTGHSFIIPHDCHIPLSAYQATVAIFGGKNLIKQGLTWNRPGDVSRGLQLLKAAAKEDMKIQAWEDLGYDLLWQTDAHFYFGDDSKVDRCFAMCNEHLMSAHGIGHYYLQRAILSGYNGRLVECENYRKKAIESFQKDFSWIGLAAVYGNDSLPHACYIRRLFCNRNLGEVDQRLRMAFLAAALEPSFIRLKNLETRAGEWTQCHDGSQTPKSYAQKLADLVLGYDGEFKSIRPIIRTDVELKLLKVGVAKAAETLARSGGV